MRTVFRPAFGRVLSIVFVVAAVFALAVVAVNSGPRALLVDGPWIVLMAGIVWAFYWRPHVAVDDGGVHVVNVLRTIDLPWPAIQRIDTKWALTLFTVYGKVTAWAAPAPGGMASRTAARRDFKGLPESSYAGDGSLRPGDLPGTASGAAALVVRSHWEALRDAGHLDDPKLEFTRPPVSWHFRTIFCGAVIVLFGLLASLLV